jgi:hypothetical protein
LFDIKDKNRLRRSDLYAGYMDRRKEGKSGSLRAKHRRETGGSIPPLTSKTHFMDSPNLGPEWLWNLVLILAAIGLILVVVELVRGIVWLFHHLKIV